MASRSRLMEETDVSMECDSNKARLHLPRVPVGCLVWVRGCLLFARMLPSMLVVGRKSSALTTRLVSNFLTSARRLTTLAHAFLCFLPTFRFAGDPSSKFLATARTQTLNLSPMCSSFMPASRIPNILQYWDSLMTVIWLRGEKRGLIRGKKRISKRRQDQ